MLSTIPSDTLSASAQYSQFEAYREFCDDHTIGIRKLGILDEHSYQLALADPATVSIDVNGTTDVPAVAPINYIIGYDNDRSKQIAGTIAASHDIPSLEALYWSYPAKELLPEEVKDIARYMKDGSYVVMLFEREIDDTVTISNIAKVALESNISVRFEPIRDPRAKETNANASLSMHTIDCGPRDAVDVSERTTFIEKFDEYVTAGLKEKRPLNGVSVFSGKQLDPDLVSGMWDLYRDRFEWLGEYHPVSMEDTFEDFSALIENEATTSVISFKDGKPVCFTFLTESVDKCYWLKPEAFRELDTEVGRKVMFFPGIVARQDAVKGHSIPVISTLAELMVDSGQELRVAFENTNLSEEYVSQIVYKLLARNKQAYVEPVVTTHKRLYEAAVLGGRS